MERVAIQKTSFFVSGPDAPAGYKNFWISVKRGEWEDYTYRVFDEFLNKEHSYLDIGAWIGPTVLYGCQLAKHCYAIEPDPVAFKILLDNINLNPNLKSKITLYNGCIGNVSGDIKLGAKTGFGDGKSSILFSDSENSLTVKSLTLDEFMITNDIKDCNFIKIDIEGGESIILPNMKTYLQKNMPTLFLSLHPFWFKDREKDSRAIIDVLKIYVNICYSDGRRLQLNWLFNKLLSLDRPISIIATKKWNCYRRLFHIFKTYKAKINRAQRRLLHLN